MSPFDDFEVTLTDVTPLTAAVGGAATMILHHEWISLGVLALEAAERAQAANDDQLAAQYTALAEKCDACADRIWKAERRRAQGTRPPGTNPR